MLTHRRRSERGQVVILFVGLFSAFLLVGVFAIDQGFWYGERRVVQADVDLAARAGAIAYLEATPSEGAARRASQTAVVANGAAPGTERVIADANRCRRTTVNAAGEVTEVLETVAQSPSVEVQVDAKARRFFSGLPFFSNDSTDVAVQARSVACAGSVGGLHVANLGSPGPGDNILKSIPIVLLSNTGGRDGSCFGSDGKLKLGEECAILRADPDLDTIFHAPASADCGGTTGTLHSNIETGVSFTCRINNDALPHHHLAANHHGGGGGGPDSDFFVILDAMQDRLDRPSGSCDDQVSGDGTGNADSFQNAFGNADGNRDNAPYPPPLYDDGGSDASRAVEADPRHVYVQNACYRDPRVVVLPITGPGHPGTVTGFATVYITGCYARVGDDEVDVCDVAPPTPGPPDPIRQRVCDKLKEKGIPWPNCPEGGPVSGPPSDACEPLYEVPDSPDDPLPAFCEIRAIPIRMFVTQEAIGGIYSIAVDGPLTIQTVQ